MEFLFVWCMSRVMHGQTLKKAENGPCKNREADDQGRYYIL